MEKRWRIEQPNEQLVQEMEKALNVPTIVARILVARGFTSPAEAQAFINVDQSIVHDPFLMHGMDEAVVRIKQAIEAQEKILVYGDYDAGATRF